MTKFIFVSGGVLSGVGKGVITASLGKILTEYGYKTTLIKADPYINYDAGTLRPTEHGEVWVTDDGGEIDQDLGTYERFLNQDVPKKNNMTSGQIYKSVIDRERSGAYLGKTVQFIPHIPEEIISRIKFAAHGYDIAIIEIGGTIGDDENIPFLFASKKLERELGFENVAHVMVTFLPIPRHLGEMKTKPTQQAIKLLRQEGLVPDFIMCRADKPIDEVRKKKIDASAHITSENIISAPNLQTVYEVPLHLHAESFGKKVIKRLGLKEKKEADFSAWAKLVARIKKPKSRIKIAICGKYIELGDYQIADSYLSVQEALIHAGAELDVGIDVTWINALDMEDEKNLKKLDEYAGIIVPGGFGKVGIEGKINVIKYARINKIPYLGLCYGMQLACVEYARNVCGMSGANTTEVDQTVKYPIVDLLAEQKGVTQKEGYGGTMRLGGYPAVLQSGSKVLELYKEAQRLEADKKVIAQLLQDKTDRFSDAMMAAVKKDSNIIVERHRHRYEINPEYVDKLSEAGLLFSGYHMRDDKTTLMEFIELFDHPFFVATQAHPEFKSRLGNPSPLFFGFVRACL
ncbi:CTP synthase [bacterium]|nr:CTP synthase [bacterium]